MNKIKFARLLRSGLAVITIAAVYTVTVLSQSSPAPAQPELGARVVKILRVDGALFKDLNKNGQLDKYEDWRLPIEARVADLLGRAQLEDVPYDSKAPLFKFGFGLTYPSGN